MTNSERIRSMTDDELAHFLEAWSTRCRKVMCPDFYWGCYHECEREYMCVNKDFYTDKSTFIKWWQAEEITHEYQNRRVENEV